MLDVVPFSAGYPYPFPPPPTAKRANTLLLKHKLVELLTPEQGQIYWELLCNLLTGKITRDEFELGWRDHLLAPASSDDIDDNGVLNDAPAIPDARQVKLELLHNALLFSILYNTTKPTLPPGNISHQGWTNKRKRREGLDTLLYPKDGIDPLGEFSAKRRRLKRVVTGMSKAEKKRLRAMITAVKADRQVSTIPHQVIEKGRLGLSISGALRTPNTGASCGRSMDSLLILPTTAVQQDIQRVAMTATCLQSAELPVLGTVQDRMSYIAYNSSLTGGADDAVASMLAVALEVRMRCPRRPGLTSFVQTYMRDLVSALVAVVPAHHRNTSSTKPAVIGRDRVSALLDMSPALLHSAHLGSVERFFAHESLQNVPDRGDQLDKRFVLREGMETVKMQHKERVKEDRERRKRAIAAENGDASQTVPVQPVAPLQINGSVKTSTTGVAQPSPLRRVLTIPTDGRGRPIKTEGTDARMSTSPVRADLQTELFPEVAAALATAPSSSVPTAVKKAGTVKTRNMHKRVIRESDDEGGAASSDEDVDTRPVRSQKPDTPTDNISASPTKEKRSVFEKERDDRGRFGVWRVLTGILDAHLGHSRSLL